MYERYTRQCLPEKEYRELLGSALVVFNSNNAFVIENILKCDSNNYNWHDLIDRESGALSNVIKDTITKHSNTKIACQFNKVVAKRNRIVHSFCITDIDGNCRLATKDKKGNQFIIDEDFLMTFIQDNQLLSDLLYLFRNDFRQSESIGIA